MIDRHAHSSKHRNLQNFSSSTVTGEVFRWPAFGFGQQRCRSSRPCAGDRGALAGPRGRTPMTLSSGSRTFGSNPLYPRAGDQQEQQCRGGRGFRREETSDDRAHVVPLVLHMAQDRHGHLALTERPDDWATTDIEASRLLEYIDSGRHATERHVTRAACPRPKRATDTCEVGRSSAGDAVAPPGMSCRFGDRYSESSSGLLAPAVLGSSSAPMSLALV